jgi:hypothetical protein
VEGLVDAGELRELGVGQALCLARLDDLLGTLNVR